MRGSFILLSFFVAIAGTGAAQAQAEAVAYKSDKFGTFEKGVAGALRANAGRTFADSSAPLEERVDDLLASLTAEEKASLIHGDSVLEFGGIPRLDIPSVGMADGPVGVRGPAATKFPSGISMASTWDADLIREVGRALGRENLAAGNRVFLAPCGDIMRTPLGGRTCEGFGEDPWLIGTITVPYVQGVQEMGVAACVKPMAANSQEKWRRSIDVKVSERALREIYLTGFERAVREGGAWSVMGAYNKINGEWCCHHDRMLNGILQGEWGFDGAVITDWGAWKNTADAINGGSTIEMPAPKPGKGAGATLRLLAENKIDKARHEDAVRRNARLLIRCGIVDTSRKDRAAISTPEHQALARKVAEESIVLLKNQNSLLPLDMSAIKSIAVIGPNADWKLTRTNYRDSGGSASVFPPYEITPLAGLRAKAAGRLAINFAEGFSYNAGAGAAFEEGRASSIEAARSSDVAIVFAGTNHTYDREATGNVRPEDADKPDLGLIGPQSELIRAVAAANPRTIVVLINGAPVTMTEWLGQVPGVLEAWFPGMEGGRAIANVLFGDVNPGGKLPVTLGKKLTDWKAHTLGPDGYPGTGRNGYVNYDDGIWIGYRWFDRARIEPEFPFGHGLSYTTFDYTNIKIRKQDTGWTASFDIINSGTRAGAEVAQLYVQPVSSKIERPFRELKGCAKVRLSPGETKNVEITVTPSHLRHWDGHAGKWAIERGDYLIAIGASSRDIRLQIPIKVE
jgi:beta-glucosidase